MPKDQPLDFLKLGDYIKAVFVDNDKYQVDKNVPTFYKEGKYVGDFFNFTMIELVDAEDPIFYHNYSPYDIISSKTTDYAAIFRSGERIADFKFEPFMVQRTAVMTSLVTKSLKLNIGDSNVLYVGTGRIAKRDLESLKVHYPKLKSIHFINQGSSSESFIEFAKSIGVKAAPTTLDNLSNYDLIICHTSSKKPVITADLIPQIKKGALITSYSSEDFTELSSEAFNNNLANVIADWPQTISEASELNQAVSSGIIDTNNIIYLKDLFDGKNLEINTDKYTIYRSHGTPMQNLAAMKLALELK